MTIHRINLDDCAPQRWRNGGGVTRELLAWPRGDDWLVRVSVADIESGGPFSPFPGVERWFTVISGEGVVLTLPERELTVSRGDAPLRFDGEAAPVCRLVEGPTRDLNLMLRRNGQRGSMLAAQAGGGIDGSTQWRGLYVAGDALVDCDGIAEPVHAGTLLWSDDRDAMNWQLRGPARAWWMLLEE